MNNRFSVCYIVKNEELNIEKTILKLIDLFGEPETIGYEILVVDTGSTDDTVNTAKKYGARVEFFEWIKDFSAARNETMKMAKYDRVLFLDADEIPEKGDLDEILALWGKYPDAIGRIERRNLCNNGEGGSCILTDRVERFFDRRLYHYEGVIHEQVTKNEAGEMYGYPIPFTVYHEGYYGTDEQLKEKAQRNNELLMKEMEKNPEDPYIYYQLGQSYDLMGDFKTSLEFYEKSYNLCPDRKTEYAGILIRSLGSIYIKLEKNEEAIKLVKEEENNFSDYGDFLCFAGHAYTRAGDLENAIKMYKKALKATLVHIEGSRTAIPLYNLGCIYEALGDEIQAKEYFESAINNGHREAKKRLDNLLTGDYENKSNRKDVAIIVPVDNTSRRLEKVWDNIKEQSIGVGHIEIVFVVMTDDKVTNNFLTEVERTYESSVCLFYPDKSEGVEENIGKAFGYTSAENVMLVNDNTALKWDAVRMMNAAMKTAETDMVTYGINYSDSDFVLSINDEKMRTDVIKSGMLKDAPATSLYKMDFLINNSVSPEHLIKSDAGVLYAKKIYCIKETLDESACI